MSKQRSLKTLVMIALTIFFLGFLILSGAANRSPPFRDAGMTTMSAMAPAPPMMKEARAFGEAEDMMQGFSGESGKMMMGDGGGAQAGVPRMVSMNAQMDVVVKDLQGAAKQFQDHVKGATGFVVSSSSYSDDSVYIVARVPAALLDAV